MTYVSHFEISKIGYFLIDTDIEFVSRIQPIMSQAVTISNSDFDCQGHLLLLLVCYFLIAHPLRKFLAGDSGVARAPQAPRPGAREVEGARQGPDRKK